MSAPRALRPGSLRALWAYFEERFPIVTYGLMVAVFALSASWLGAARFGPEGPLALHLGTAAGALVLFLSFFHLRVFDEHKDAEGDRLAHPDRVLSRGLVTLPQLLRLGIVAIVVQAALAALLGYVALAVWAAALVYALGMRVEFFCPDFLRRHVLLYAVTHNPVVALFALFAVAVGQGGGQLLLDVPIALYLGLSSAASLVFEVGRKVRAPDDEREGQDTYSEALGVSKATLLGIVLTLLVGSVGSFLGWAADFSIFYHGAFLALSAWGVLAWVRYGVSPNHRNVKQVATVTSLIMLASFLLVAVELGLARGVAPRWLP